MDVSERPAGLYMRDGTICERDAWMWDAWVWDAWVWDAWVCKLIWDVEIDFSVHANEGHTVALYTLPLYILPYRHTRSVVILTSCSHTGT